MGHGPSSGFRPTSCLRRHQGVVREAETLSFQDAMNRMTKKKFRTVDILYSSQDQLEGARAFAEKRDPVWKGR